MDRQHLLRHLRQELPQLLRLQHFDPTERFDGAAENLNPADRPIRLSPSEKMTASADQVKLTSVWIHTAGFQFLDKDSPPAGSRRLPGAFSSSGDEYISESRQGTVAK